MATPTVGDIQYDLLLDFRKFIDGLDFSKKSVQRLSKELARIENQLNDKVLDAGSLSKIVKRIDRVKSSTKEWTKETEKQVEAQKKLTKQTGRSLKPMNLLRATAASLAGNIGSNLVFGTIEAATATFKLGVEAQRAETRFVSFADSIRQGRVQYEEYFNIAQRLGVDFDPLVELGTQFRAVGFEAQEAADLIERLTIAAGGSVQAVDGIGRSLRQIRAGKVELEELNPIAEAGVPIFKLLADELGITEKALRGLLETGDVTRETFFKAFRTFTDEGSKARFAAEETAKTASAAIERLQNTYQKFAKTFAETFEQDIIQVIQLGIGALEKFESLFGTTLFRGAPTPTEAQVNQQFGLGPGSFNFSDPTGQRGVQGRTPADASERLLGLYRQIYEVEQKIAETEKLRGIQARSRVAAYERQLEALNEQARAQSVLLQILEDQEAARPDTPEGISDNQKELNSFIREAEQLEKQRLTTIRGVRREQELGLLKEEEAKTRIDTINTKAVQDLIKLNDAITEHADKLTEVERTTVAWDATITKVASEQARIAALVEQQRESLIGLVEQYMLYNQGSNIQANTHQSLIEAEMQIEQIERNRLETIQRINAELNAGAITYEEAQEQIKEANEDAIIDSNLIFANVKKMADTLGDPNLKSRFISLFREGKQEAVDLLRVTRQIQRSLGGGQDRPLERGDAGREDAGGPSISGGGGTALGNNFEFGQGTWWKEIADFADSEAFSRIEQGVGIISDAFEGVGEIIQNGVNAQLEALNNRLREIREQNRITREELKQQYEEDLEDIQRNFDQQKTDAQDLRDQKIADAKSALMEGKLTAKQLSDERIKAEREYGKTVKRLNKEAGDERERLKEKRKKDIQELKNSEIRAQNEIRQKKYEADLQAFYFNQALRYSQVFIEGALAFVRAIPDPFAMAASVISTGISAGIIASATPPAKPPPIPMFEKGGFVDEPTLLIAGERGREYILTEAMMNRFSGQKPDINVYVDNVAADPTELVEMIRDTVRENY